MSADKPTFSFKLGEPGTATACLVFDGNESEFELSNVSNPLDDMLSGLAGLLTTPSQLWDEENAAHFVWYCDEESYNWALRLNKDNSLDIKISQSCDFLGEELEMVNGTCALPDFVFCIVSELDRFIKQVGLLNYQQQWQAYEFPLTYFLFLKKYLIDNGLWVVEEDNAKNILSDEMRLLLG